MDGDDSFQYFLHYLEGITCAFSVLTLLVRCQEERPACKNWVMRCLGVVVATCHLPLRSRPPLRLRGLGQRWSPSPNVCINLHLLIAQWRIFFCVCCPFKESFRDIFVNHSPSRKKIWITQFGSCWGGIVSFLGGGNPPPQKKTPGSGVNAVSWPCVRVTVVRRRCDCTASSLLTINVPTQLTQGGFYARSGLQAQSRMSNTLRFLNHRMPVLSPETTASMPRASTFRQTWSAPIPHTHCLHSLSIFPLLAAPPSGGLRLESRVVECWCGCLSGARCRLAYGPADATATHCHLLQ